MKNIAELGKVCKESLFHGKDELSETVTLRSEWKQPTTNRLHTIKHIRNGRQGLAEQSHGRCREGGKEVKGIGECQTESKQHRDKRSNHSLVKSAMGKVREGDRGRCVKDFESPSSNREKMKGEERRAWVS